MDDFIVVVDKIEDWQPYFQTEQVVTVKSYLFDKKYQEAKDLRIINLSRKFKYLSLGYYCCLLAEARNHKIIPRLKTINDLRKKNLYMSDLEEFQEIITQLNKDFMTSNEHPTVKTFRIYFSKVILPEYQTLANEIYDLYPVPILEVKLAFDKVWKIANLGPVSLKDLDDEEETFFANALEQFSSKIWRLPREQKSYVYDLGILVNPDEKLPPSDEKALAKFRAACERQNVYSEFITKRDISKLYEFDALFIRETTTISNHTYRFAKTALSEGLAVIDDPESMLKCTNKIFVSNLLDRLHIPSIPGKFVSNSNSNTIKELVENFGYPMVVKIPDGSFSIGVKKVENENELISVLNEMLKKSDLILVQKFLYTDYDWRVGVLGGEGLYACKYFMSRDHWQIYNHEKDREGSDFSGDALTVPLEQVPIKVLNTAIRASRSIGNGLYGVDLKEDSEGNVYVVEINDNPNIDDDVEDKVLGPKLYDKLVSWFIKEIKKKKNSAIVTINEE